MTLGQMLPVRCLCRACELQFCNVANWRSRSVGATVVSHTRTYLHPSQMDVPQIDQPLEADEWTLSDCWPYMRKRRSRVLLPSGRWYHFRPAVRAHQDLCR